MLNTLFASKTTIIAPKHTHSFFSHMSIAKFLCTSNYVYVEFKKIVLVRSWVVQGVSLNPKAYFKC